MSSSQAKRIVKFIREQKSTCGLKDVLVDKYEIGYDEAALLIMMSKTNFG